MLNKSIRFCFKFSLIISSIISAVIAYIALDHNPMGEYCTPITDIRCDIIWANLLPLILIWFLVLFALLMIITSTVIFMRHKISKSGKG